MAVFGVDFGNLNSVVSVARKGGIDIITNEVSSRETPSIVSFGNKQRSLGEKAADMVIRNWKNTIGSLKRLIGVTIDSEAGRHELKFLKSAFRADANGFLELKVMYKTEEYWFKPEQLVGMLFTQLRRLAEIETATDARVEVGSIKVVDCVVSVPIFFTSTQRRLLTQGLQIAGLNPLNILNETTAAALDWGIFKSNSLPEDEKNSVVIAFVDVGQSATTCSVVSFMKGQLKVLGHVYDRFLGCRDFDYILFEHFSAQVFSKYKVDVSEDKKNALKLLQSIEKCKKVLSANQTAILNCEMSEFDVSFPNIQREDFENMWQPNLQKLNALLQQALQIPGADRISAVELIGGGSRIPCVKAAISAAFEKPIQTTLNASESVAKGCGIMAAMMSPKFKVREFSVIDTNVYTINLGYHSDKSQNPIHDPNFPEINKRMVVLKPGDACPKTLNLSFDRSHDFDLFVFYDDSSDAAAVSHDLLIGKWRISSIPTISPEQPAVKVRLRMAPTMLITVEGASVLEEWEEEEVVEKKVPKDAAKPEVPAEEAGTSSDAMETDEAKAAEQVVTEVVKRKKSKRHDCVVTSLKFTGNSEAELAEFQSREQQMIQSDLNVALTQEAKNALESYMYDARSKISPGGLHADYITPSDRDTFMSALAQEEDWLYAEGEDTSKDEYVAHLSALRKLGNPVAARYTERTALPTAFASLRAKCEALALQAKNADGKLAHVPAEELASVETKCSQALQWAAAEEAKLASTSLTADTPIKSSAVDARLKEVEQFSNPILTKPKPKEEKKKEEAAKESPPPTSPASPAGPGDKPADAKMDLD